MNTIALIVGYAVLLAISIVVLLLLVNLLCGFIAGYTRAADEATVHELRHRPPVHPRRGAHR